MRGTNQRTWQQYRVGHLLVTVQLDSTAERRNAEDQRKLADSARFLIGLMDSYRLPTTWAVSDPAHSAATPLILRSPLDHELAILGDACWLGPTAGRTRFARELARRILQARTSGLTITSLVPRAPTIERHIDLLVKQRISAVCGQPSPDRQFQTPRALHYGIWEFPVSISLPAKSNWFLSSGWLAWRRIRRAASEAATLHLAIDAPQIAVAGYRGEKTLSRLLRRVVQLRDRGMLNVETLRAASGRFAAVPAATPQHSILRRAA